MLLAVFLGEVLEIAWPVVSAAVFESHVRPVDLHGDAAIVAVHARIGAAIAEDVIGGCVGLDALVGLGEIVSVEEGVAAGVGGESGEGFLGLEIGIELLLSSSTGVSGVPANAGGCCAAPGSEGFEAAGVDGIE